jgi:sugar phosphate isomerase/epimerase
MHSFTRRQILALPTLAALSRTSFAIPLSQVRLGVTTDEIDEDLLVAIRLLKEFGLGYAEVRSVWGKYNTSQPVEKICEARALLDEHKIKVSVLGTAFFKTALPSDNKALQTQWDLLDAAMERAVILGTNTLRIFAFTYKAAEGLKDSDYPRIQELLTEAAKRAKPKNIKLAIENVDSSYVSTAAQAARVLGAVKDDTIGLAWDPNNAGAAGERAFPDGFRLLDPARIIHVHLRDYRHNDAGKVEWCAVGKGEFDNLGQIRALLKSGYKGAFTLETHYRDPQGKAFATRTSLTALLKVFAKV